MNGDDRPNRPRIEAALSINRFARSVTLGKLSARHNYQSLTSWPGFALQNFVEALVYISLLPWPQGPGCPWELPHLAPSTGVLAPRLGFEWRQRLRRIQLSAATRRVVESQVMVSRRRVGRVRSKRRVPSRSPGARREVLARSPGDRCRRRAVRATRPRETGLKD